MMKSQIIALLLANTSAIRLQKPAMPHSAPAFVGGIPEAKPEAKAAGAGAGGAAAAGAGGAAAAGAGGLPAELGGAAGGLPAELGGAAAAAGAGGLPAELGPATPSPEKEAEAAKKEQESKEAAKKAEADAAAAAKKAADDAAAKKAEDEKQKKPEETKLAVDPVYEKKLPKKKLENCNGLNDGNCVEAGTGAKQRYLYAGSNPGDSQSLVQNDGIAPSPKPENPANKSSWNTPQNGDSSSLIQLSQGPDAAAPAEPKLKGVGADFVGTKNGDSQSLVAAAPVPAELGPAVVTAPVPAELGPAVVAKAEPAKAAPAPAPKADPVDPKFNGTINGDSQSLAQGDPLAELGIPGLGAPAATAAPEAPAAQAEPAAAPEAPAAKAEPAAAAPEAPASDAAGNDVAAELGAGPAAPAKADAKAADAKAPAKADAKAADAKDDKAGVKDDKAAAKDDKAAAKDGAAELGPDAAKGDAKKEKDPANLEAPKKDLPICTGFNAGKCQEADGKVDEPKEPSWDGVSNGDSQSIVQVSSDKPSYNLANIKVDTGDVVLG